MQDARVAIDTIIFSCMFSYGIYSMFMKWVNRVIRLEEKGTDVLQNSEKVQYLAVLMCLQTTGLTKKKTIYLLCYGEEGQPVVRMRLLRVLRELLRKKEKIEPTTNKKTNHLNLKPKERREGLTD